MRWPEFSPSSEDYHLPTILSLEEINHLLEFVDDIKYKAIFSLLYGSGLRVSEAVYLDYCDISRTNMTVHVRKSKSRIDRYTILSVPTFYFTSNIASNNLAASLGSSNIGLCAELSNT